MADSFATRARLDVNGTSYAYCSLARLGERFDLARLPFSMKILLENLLRHEDGITVLPAHIEAVASWDPKAEPDTEIAFMPARVLLQDFTGVPCVVDLAAMRDAVARLGGQPSQINPLVPSELVIDHSVQVDVFGRPDALDLNSQIEYQRNGERYSFLVAFELDLAVEVQRLGLAEHVDLHRMVDDQLGRNQRIDLAGVAAERDDRVAHRRQVDHAGHAGEVLQHHARRHEGDLGVGLGGGVPAGDGLDVLLADRDSAVLAAQQVLEQDLHRVRETRQVEALAELRQAVERVGAPVDGQLVAGGEGVAHGQAPGRNRGRRRSGAGRRGSSVLCPNRGGPVPRRGR